MFTIDIRVSKNKLKLTYFDTNVFWSTAYALDYFYVGYTLSYFILVVDQP